MDLINKTTKLICEHLTTDLGATGFRLHTADYGNKIFFFSDEMIGFVGLTVSDWRGVLDQCESFKRCADYTSIAILGNSIPVGVRQSFLSLDHGILMARPSEQPAWIDKPTQHETAAEYKQLLMQRVRTV